jgi:hypothetical protein
MARGTQRTEAKQKERKRKRPYIKYGPIKFNNINQHNNIDTQENPIIEKKIPISIQHSTDQPHNPRKGIIK